MNAPFDHDNLKVYQEAIAFVAWLEDLRLSDHDAASARDHLDRSSAGMPICIAEASGKRSENERRQYIDTAYGSSLECAACFDVLGIHGCVSDVAIHEGKTRLVGIVSMLIGFRRSTGGMLCEESAAYGTTENLKDRVWFDHEKLNVYHKALEIVRWKADLMRTNRIARPVLMALDRATTGLPLNIAEGNGKFRPKDRCRFIGHARTYALQTAATLDVLAIRHPGIWESIEQGKTLLADAVRMLVAWEKSTAERE